jgi:hypothetical protein
MLTTFATSLALFAVSASATQLQEHPHYGPDHATNEAQDPADGTVTEGHYLHDEEFSPDYIEYRPSSTGSETVKAFCDLGDVVNFVQDPGMPVTI